MHQPCCCVHAHAQVSRGHTILRMENSAHVSRGHRLLRMCHVATGCFTTQGFSQAKMSSRCSTHPAAQRCMLLCPVAHHCTNAHAGAHAHTDPRTCSYLPTSVIPPTKPTNPPHLPTHVYFWIRRTQWELISFSLAAECSSRLPPAVRMGLQRSST